MVVVSEHIVEKEDRVLTERVVFYEEIGVVVKGVSSCNNGETLIVYTEDIKKAALARYLYRNNYGLANI